MCQPKPGPRCSGHARSALEAKRVAKEQAETARDEAQAAFRACDSTNPVEREELRRAAVEADKAYWDATSAHTAALREYETTPEGMVALEQAIATFEVEGDEAAAATVRRRLEEAQATRAEQVADLAMSRRHRERLANPTTEELAALDQSDAEVSERSAAVESLTAQHAALDEQWRATAARAAEVDRVEDEAQRAWKMAAEESHLAAEEVRVHAERLYVEAGVAPRFAMFYSNDMVEAAQRHPGAPYRRSANVYAASDPFAAVQQPMKVKVKRDGPDRDKTLAAKVAAESDEAFQAANARLVERINEVAAAKTAADAARRNAETSIREERQTVAQARSVARYALEDAVTDRDRAVARREDLRARIGSGLGAEPTTTIDMQRVRDEIVRNPDGTTNAYVYNAPSEGFPHGRYIPATGVTTVQGMGSANALVLENGRRAWLHGHYSRTTRGAGETQSGYQKVVVVAPQEGAHPLREENLASAGFYTFVDSSD